MKTIYSRNVNDAYAQCMVNVENGSGLSSYPSRNGPMVEFNTPVTTIYKNPCERVLFDGVRDCNPFLHFFESLWMLAGRDDLDFVTRYAKNMENFSDNGETLNGAYGFRWRNHFGYDQIEDAYQELKKDPMSRRVVTQMWDGSESKLSKDIPCNTSIMWRLRGGILDMTVTNRSNDIIWGCYGANAVHFSFLHEYMAACLDVKVGYYYQISNSLHYYPEFDVTKRILAGPRPPLGACAYERHEISHYPIFTGGATKAQFDGDLEAFFHEYDHGAGHHPITNFFKDVVHPMYLVHSLFKDGDKDEALRKCEYIAEFDWQLACVEWLIRRGAEL